MTKWGVLDWDNENEENFDSRVSDEEIRRGIEEKAVVGWLKNLYLDLRDLRDKK